MQHTILFSSFLEYIMLEGEEGGNTKKKSMGYSMSYTAMPR